MSMIGDFLSYVLTIMLYTGLTTFYLEFHSLPDTTAHYTADSGVHPYMNLKLPFINPSL